MEERRAGFKSIVAAGLLAVGFSAPLAADQARLDELYAQLAGAESAEAAALIVYEIRGEWSRSGSAAVDLLLDRGADAVKDRDWPAAIEHLTAAIDHAPGFAEAYHLRATAYYMSGDAGPALSDLLQTLVLNPRHFGAMQGIAVILEETGQRERALETYREILSIHPQEADVARAVERLSREIEGQSL